MLYFSKIKIVSIYFIVIFLSIFSLSNFLNINTNSFLSKKINLGLDLQGGSYLLLEVDSKPIIKQNLQIKLISLRKILKENNISYQLLKIKNESISFKINELDLKLFEDLFFDQKNSMNIYYDKYSAYEMDSLFDKDKVTISYTKFGIIEIKNSSLDQSLEIVRRRIDEVGTKDPTIIKRGSNRILIELPGLDDPNRIKNLLGKTANLTFRIVSDSDDDFGSEFLFLRMELQKLRLVRE